MGRKFDSPDVEPPVGKEKLDSGVFLFSLGTWYIELYVILYLHINSSVYSAEFNQALFTKGHILFCPVLQWSPIFLALQAGSRMGERGWFCARTHACTPFAQMAGTHVPFAQPSS